MDNPDDKKEDYKTFYMKQKYRQDTYQAGGNFLRVSAKKHFQPEMDCKMSKHTEFSTKMVSLCLTLIYVNSDSA